MLAGGAGWVPTVSSNVASRALGRTSMAAYCSTENIPRAESSLGRVRRRDAMLEHGRAAESEAAGSGERAHRRGSEGHEENARDQPHFRTEVLPCSDPRDDSFNSYKLITVGVLPRAAQPTTEPNQPQNQTLNTTHHPASRGWRNPSFCWGRRLPGSLRGCKLVFHLHMNHVCALPTPPPLSPLMPTPASTPRRPLRCPGALQAPQHDARAPSLNPRGPSTAGGGQVKTLSSREDWTRSSFPAPVDFLT